MAEEAQGQLLPNVMATRHNMPRQPIGLLTHTVSTRICHDICSIYSALEQTTETKKPMRRIDSLEPQC